MASNTVHRNGKGIFVFLFFTLVCFTGYAQGVNEINLLEQRRELMNRPVTQPAYLEVNEDSLLNILDAQPSFGLYRDNYVITGIPLNRRITRTTADVKIQISVRQRLTQSVLPFKTFLYLGFTQRIYWYLYERSAPFADINLNPSITLAKNVIKDNKLYGYATISIEHESNGKGGEESRSWNLFSFSYTHFFNPYFSMQGKFWIPWWIDKKYTPRFPRYRGVGLIALNYTSFNERFGASLVVYPRKRIGNANVTVEMNYKINKKSNQFMFMQFYSGCAEDMMEYTRHKTMVRIGFNIRPRIGNIY